MFIIRRDRIKTWLILLQVFPQRPFNPPLSRDDWRLRFGLTGIDSIAVNQFSGI